MEQSSNYVRDVVFRAFAEALSTPCRIEPLKDGILRLVEQDGTPTFAAVARLPGGSGKSALVVTGANVTLFFGLSWDAISAITELQIDGLVRIEPTAPLVYALEGIWPSLPLAEPGRTYASEHWLPTVLVAGPA